MNEVEINQNYDLESWVRATIILGVWSAAFNTLALEVGKDIIVGYIISGMFIMNYLNQVLKLLWIWINWKAQKNLDFTE
jgi:hypothetical protein